MHGPINIRRFLDLGKRSISYNKRQRKTGSPITQYSLQPESSQATVQVFLYVRFFVFWYVVKASCTNTQVLEEKQYFEISGVKRYLTLFFRFLNNHIKP